MGAGDKIVYLLYFWIAPWILSCPAHLSRIDLGFLIMSGKEYNDAHLSRSGHGFDPRSGQVSWVRFSMEAFVHKVPEYHKAVIIILSYSPC